MLVLHAGQQGGAGGGGAAPAELAVDVARPRGVRAQLRQPRVVALLHACASAAFTLCSKTPTQLPHSQANSKIHFVPRTGSLNNRVPYLCRAMHRQDTIL